MAIKQDFTDHPNVILMITEVQDSENDQREQVEEQKVFILEKDGQWDERTTNLMDKRYRGTFDQVSPILEQISGEMTTSQFAISVSPASGDATESTAEVYDGLIRNIENISNADQIYSQIGDSMVMAGLDGFEIVQDHLDANTFDQDIIFKPVSDWYKSVWFDLGSIKQDKSDANWAIKLREMPVAAYKEQFPKGSGVSIGDNLDISRRRIDNDDYESVSVGRLYYKKPIDIELVKMTSGAVYVKDEEFKKIEDELAQAGELIVDERTRKSWRVWSRLLDGSDFLSEEEETVFTYIPLIPFYGNYNILDKRTIYFGKTLKLMDSQRGINFAVSAETEEVALSPNDAVWMSKAQAAGEDYSKMNIDRKAVRFYNPSEDGTTPPPFKMGGKMGNPGLQSAAASFQGLLRATGNMDDPSMGQNPGLQSGVAIDSLISQSNNGNVKWSKSMEIGICHAYRVCVDAIPRVYDGSRQQRLLGEDGKSKMVTLNTNVFDQQTQQNVEANDLSKGVYDVTCSMGAAFKNQQDKATQHMIELLAIDPNMLERARDVLYKNQTWPGSDVVAKRARKLGIESGVIGQDEWTEEEAAEIQAAQEAAEQQPPQEDPNMIIARAEEGKAQAELQNAQNKQAEVQGNQQLKAQELQLEGNKLGLENQKQQLEKERFLLSKQDKNNLDRAKIDQGQQKLDQSQQQMLIDASQGQEKMDLDAQAQDFNQKMALKDQQIAELTAAFNNLKTGREAAGVDVFVGPHTTEAIINQAVDITEKQEEQGIESPVRDNDFGNGDEAS